MSKLLTPAQEAYVDLAAKAAEFVQAVDAGLIPCERAHMPLAELDLYRQLSKEAS